MSAEMSTEDKTIECPKCRSERVFATVRVFADRPNRVVIGMVSVLPPNQAVFELAKELSCQQCGHTGPSNAFFKPKVPPLTEKEYVKEPICPHCRSADLEPDWADTETDPGRVSVWVKCANCGRKHRAVYSLSDYEK